MTIVQWMHHCKKTIKKNKEQKLSHAATHKKRKQQEGRCFWNCWHRFQQCTTHKKIWGDLNTAAYLLYNMEESSSNIGCFNNIKPSCKAPNLWSIIKQFQFQEEAGGKELSSWNPLRWVLWTSPTRNNLFLFSIKIEWQYSPNTESKKVN